MLLQEGLANVCLVGGSTTLVRAHVEANLPRKRGAAALGYDKAGYVAQNAQNACNFA